MDLSEDKRNAKISIDRNFDAEQMELLITLLMSLRGKMLPDVPSSPNPESLMSYQEEGGFAMRLMPDQRVQLLFRHAGAGWLPFALNVEQACALRDFLIANTPTSDPSPLANFQIGSGDLPQ
jgi:hypothetical protein